MRDWFGREFNIMRVAAAIAISIAMILAAGTSEVSAASANAPVPENIKYQGEGNVVVEFREQVKYRRTTVTLKDNKGKKYSARIIHKKSGSISFHVNSYNQGRTYKFWIKGIKVKGFMKYATAFGKFKIGTKGKVVVEDVSYDSRDKEVKFTFANKVKWKDPSIKIKKNGKTYKATIIDTGKKSLQIKVKGLTYGKKYKYKISGIRSAKAVEYGSVKGYFKAVN